MTRKDYKLIAGVIYANYCGSECEEAIIKGLCAAFKADNAAFNPAKFAEACRTGKGA